MVKILQTFHKGVIVMQFGLANFFGVIVIRTSNIPFEIVFHSFESNWNFRKCSRWHISCINTSFQSIPCISFLTSLNQFFGMLAQCEWALSSRKRNCSPTAASSVVEWLQNLIWISFDSECAILNKITMCMTPIPSLHNLHIVNFLEQIVGYCGFQVYAK